MPSDKLSYAFNFDVKKIRRNDQRPRIGGRSITPTMSSPECEVPDSVKEKLHDKLVESSALDRIDHRIKQGMCAAIEKLRGDNTSKPIFDAIGFDKPDNEIHALQVIFDYLKRVGLTWTLEALTQETNVKAESKGIGSPLIDILQYPDGKPPEPSEDGEEDDHEVIQDEEEEEEEEPP
jgi:hypothetical protein